LLFIIKNYIFVLYYLKCILIYIICLIYTSTCFWYHILLSVHFSIFLDISYSIFSFICRYFLIFFTCIIYLIHTTTTSSATFSTCFWHHILLSVHFSMLLDISYSIFSFICRYFLIFFTYIIYLIHTTTTSSATFSTCSWYKSATFTFGCIFCARCYSAWNTFKFISTSL